MKHLFNNKTAKGLVSFIAIIVLLSSILATSLFYQNNITASVVREDSANWESAAASITEVDDISGLNQLNEGWYEVRNGFLFYLDTFNSYVPLYIRIANIEYNDGLLVVDGDGNVEFSYRINGVNEKVIADEEEETVKNQITGNLVKVTGAAAAQVPLVRMSSAKTTNFNGEQADVAWTGTQWEIRSCTPKCTTGHLTDENINQFKNPTSKVALKYLKDNGYREENRDKIFEGLYNWGLENQVVITKSETDLTSQSKSSFWNIIWGTFPFSLLAPSKAEGAELPETTTPPKPSPAVATTTPATAASTPTQLPSYVRYVIITNQGKSSEVKPGDIIIETEAKTPSVYRLDPADGKYKKINAAGEPMTAEQFESFKKRYPHVTISAETLTQVLVQKPSTSSPLAPVAVSTSSLSIVFNQGKSGTTEEGTPIPTNIFSPGQPFYFDPTTAKDLGDGIYQIQTPDGKPVLYDTKGKGGHMVYIQSITSENLIRYLLESEQYVKNGERADSLSIENYNPAIQNAWKTATISLATTQPLTEQGKNFITSLINQEAERLAKTEGRENPNEEDLKKAKESYLKNIENQPLANKPEIEKFVGGYTYTPVKHQAPSTAEPTVSSPEKKVEEKSTGRLIIYEDDTSMFVGKDGTTRFYDKDGSLISEYKSDVNQRIQAPAPSAPSPTPSVLPTPTIGQTIQLNIVDLTKIKPGEVGKPGASATLSATEASKVVQQHAVKVAENEYQIVTVYKDGDKQSVAVNKAVPEIKDGKITGFKVGDSISTDAVNPIILQNANLKEWTGKLDNVPIANGVRDASGCLYNLPTCTYTDYFKDQSRSTTTITPTEKTTEKFKIAYYLDGKELSTDEYFRLKPEEKNKVTKVDSSPTYRYEERSVGEKVYATNYEFFTVFVNNKPVRVYEAVTRDIATGKITEFTYGEGNQKITIKTPDGVSILDIFSTQYKMEGDISNKNLLDKASTAFNQLASRQFFASVERVLTEFQGLGYYAPLFFDEDALLEWRDRVDRVFATLYLGTEYWSSSICGSYLDGEDEGIAYAETPQGYSQVGAHVEATRSEPLITPTGVEFLYKITFNIRNGDYDEDPRAPEEMEYNVVLKGERTVSVFRQPQTVERGSSSGKTGRSAIVKYSPVLYTKVCLEFDKIPLRWKLDNGELCNTIVSTGGAATPIASSGASGTSAGSGTGEFNDF